MTNQPKRFQRTIEDFTCGHCGAAVHGDGYTNHCPRCLWSRHVDVNPGDRDEPCNGMMEPVRIEHEKRREVVVHRCQQCGVERRNSVNVKDDREVVLTVAKTWSDRATHGR
jgi:hypothetical protein